MKKYYRIILFNIVLNVLFVLLLNPVHANVLDFTTKDLVKMGAASIISLFIFLILSAIFITITTFVEFFVGWLFLKNKIDKPKNLLKAFLTVNIITWPISELILVITLSMLTNAKHHMLALMGTILVYFLVELIPIISEIFLLRWQLKGLYKKKHLNNMVPNQTTVLISISANLLSAFLGVIIELLLSTLFKFLTL